MKYALLLKTFFAAYSCAPVIFNKLSSDVLEKISNYLDKPLDILIFLDKKSREDFNEKFSVKHFVHKAFDVPELKNVDANDPLFEFYYNLSWCAKDKPLLFRALKHEAVRFDPPSLPLLKHLLRISKDTNLNQYKYNHSFIDYLLKHDQMKLAVEFLSIIY